MARSLATAGLALLICGLTAPAAATLQPAVRLAKLRPGTGLRQITLVAKRDLDVQVHGVGAGEKRGNLYAYGWIVDARSSELVWSMVDAEPRAVRATERTLAFHEQLRLPAGHYHLCFYAGRRHQQSDGLDLKDLFVRYKDAPEHWMLALYVDPADREALVLSVDPPASTHDRIQLAPLGHDAMLRRRFRMLRPAQVELLAVGEAYPRGQQLSDRSWLVSLESRETVWRMDPKRSEHAGGARKNRIVRERVKLAAGSYELVAVTDESHSFANWNALPPYAANAWGVTLRAPRGTLDFSDVPAETIVARLMEAHDGEALTATFRVDRPLQARVYGLGEWSSGRGDLVDVGWLENADTRTKVWRMRYEGSDHAGGASRNRMLDTSIELEPGTYQLHYVTDDSHSPRRWRGLPPFDPRSWGIQVSTFDPDASWELLHVDVERRREHRRRHRHR